MFDIRLLLFVLLSRCYFLLMDSEPSHSAGGGSLRYLSLANLGDRILQSSLGMEKDRRTGGPQKNPLLSINSTPQTPQPLESKQSRNA